MGRGKLDHLSFLQDTHKCSPFNLFVSAERQGDKRSPPPTCPASCFPCNLTDNVLISFAYSSAKHNASIYMRALQEFSNMWCVEMQARNIKNHVSFLPPWEIIHEKAALLSVYWGKLVNISLYPGELIISLGCPHAYRFSSLKTEQIGIKFDFEVHLFGVCVCTMTHVWRSEGSLQELSSCCWHWWQVPLPGEPSKQCEIGVLVGFDGMK